MYLHDLPSTDSFSSRPFSISQATESWACFRVIPHRLPSFPWLMKQVPSLPVWAQMDKNTAARPGVSPSTDARPAAAFDKAPGFN